MTTCESDFLDRSTDIDVSQLFTNRGVWVHHLITSAARANLSALLAGVAR